MGFSLPGFRAWGKCERLKPVLLEHISRSGIDADAFLRIKLPWGRAFHRGRVRTDAYMTLRAAMVLTTIADPVVLEGYCANFTA